MKGIYFGMTMVLFLTIAAPEASTGQIAPAWPDHNGQIEAHRGRGVQISLSEAIMVALRYQPGRVLSARLIIAEPSFYRIRILARNGHIKTVDVREHGGDIML